MDRISADFERTCQMITDRLGAEPLPIQLPIGKEDNFAGVIDLFTMQALIFTDELGAKPSVEPIPARHGRSCQSSAQTHDQAHRRDRR
ncbi:MAG: hypothetical protein R3A10_03080 [Caldilineaceae bacterium]